MHNIVNKIIICRIDLYFCSLLNFESSFNKTQYWKRFHRKKVNICEKIIRKNVCYWEGFKNEIIGKFHYGGRGGGQTGNFPKKKHPKRTGNCLNIFIDTLIFSIFGVRVSLLDLDDGLKGDSNLRHL